MKKTILVVVVVVILTSINSCTNKEKEFISGTIKEKYKNINIKTADKLELRSPEGKYVIIEDIKLIEEISDKIWKINLTKQIEEYPLDGYRYIIKFYINDEMIFKINTNTPIYINYDSNEGRRHVYEISNKEVLDQLNNVIQNSNLNWKNMGSN